MKDQNIKGKIRQETDLKRLKLYKQRHLDNGYSFITAEIVRDYQHKYQKNPDSKRILRLELEEIFGLTEIEATNILLNRNVADYLRRYQRIARLERLKINNDFDQWVLEVEKNNI